MTKIDSVHYPKESEIYAHQHPHTLNKCVVGRLALSLYFSCMNLQLLKLTKRDQVRIEAFIVRSEISDLGMQPFGLLFGIAEKIQGQKS